MGVALLQSPLITSHKLPVALRLSECSAVSGKKSTRAGHGHRRPGVVSASGGRGMCSPQPAGSG